MVVDRAPSDYRTENPRFSNGRLFTLFLLSLPRSACPVYASFQEKGELVKAGAVGRTGWAF